MTITDNNLNLNNYLNADTKALEDYLRQHKTQESELYLKIPFNNAKEIAAFEKFCVDQKQALEDYKLAIQAGWDKNSDEMWDLDYDNLYIIKTYAAGKSVLDADFLAKIKQDFHDDLAHQYHIGLLKLVRQSLQEQQLNRNVGDEPIIADIILLQQEIIDLEPFVQPFITKLNTLQQNDAEINNLLATRGAKQDSAAKKRKLLEQIEQKPVQLKLVTKSDNGPTNSGFSQQEKLRDQLVTKLKSMHTRIELWQKPEFQTMLDKQLSLQNETISSLAISNNTKVAVEPQAESTQNKQSIDILPGSLLAQLKSGTKLKPLSPEQGNKKRSLDQSSMQAQIKVRRQQIEPEDESEEDLEFVFSSKKPTAASIDIKQRLSLLNQKLSSFKVDLDPNDVAIELEKITTKRELALQAQTDLMAQLLNNKRESEPKALPSKKTHLFTADARTVSGKQDPAKPEDTIRGNFTSVLKDIRKSANLTQQMIPEIIQAGENNPQIDKIRLEEDMHSLEDIKQEVSSLEKNTSMSPLIKLTHASDLGCKIAYTHVRVAAEGQKVKDRVSTKYHSAQAEAWNLFSVIKQAFKTLLNLITNLFKSQKKYNPADFSGIEKNISKLEKNTSNTGPDKSL